MTEFAEFDPQFDVWNHLEGGLQQARDELRALDPRLRKAVEGLAEAIADTRGLLILPTSKAALLHAEGSLLNHPWIKHATDIQIAEEGVSRANEALERYVALKPTIAPRALPAPAIRYLKEAAATYLFGFDAACIALCRATLEHLLKRYLVEKGICTDVQLKRVGGAGTLLEKAKQAGVRGPEYDAAKRVVERGDHVMHRNIHEDRNLKKTASDSVNDLVRAALAILG